MKAATLDLSNRAHFLESSRLLQNLNVSAVDAALEHLHQWLQPSKQPNVAPFGRLDGWSTGGWDPLQN